MILRKRHLPQDNRLHSPAEDLYGEVQCESPGDRSFFHPAKRPTSCNVHTDRHKRPTTPNYWVERIFDTTSVQQKYCNVGSEILPIGILAGSTCLSWGFCLSVRPGDAQIWFNKIAAEMMLSDVSSSAEQDFYSYVKMSVPPILVILSLTSAIQTGLDPLTSVTARNS